MLQRSSQLGITVMVLLAVSAVAQTPDLNTIVERMTAAQVAAHGNVRPYEVTRQYLYYQGDIKPQPDSNVIASVTYNPPDSKEYSIQNATGSGRGQHVVRKVLDHETQMAGQWQQSAVTEENYKFSLLGE